MASERDIVIVILPGKMIDRYTYVLNYVYSMSTKRLLEPNDTGKHKNVKYWKDYFCLHPGKYIIIEVDVDIENNYTCKSLNVFTKEEYLLNKRKQFPNADINKFKKLYHLNGLEITEWKECIPNWVKLPKECIPEIQEEYRQPQEVEDTLSALLIKDDAKKSTGLLLEKYGGIK